MKAESGGEDPRADIVQIAREHYDAVFRFCARRVGPDRAADIAQETFLTAQQALRRFRGESSIKTWLLGIANNETRRAIRQRPPEACGLDYALEMAHGAPTDGVLIDREVLRAALLRLSPEHREAVLLHELDGLTYGEAAELLGIPEGTVKSRVHHAFMNLREWLNEEDAFR